MAVISTAVLLVMFAAGAAAGTVTGLGATQNAAIRAAEAWVFIKNPPPNPNAPKPDLHKPLHIPGSTRTYTLAQWTMFSPLDWFPQDHPPMPQVVGRGRKPAWACAVCHQPSGEGEPITASLAGLPMAFIIEQIQAFRSGERSGSGDVPKMNEEARNLDDADLQQAAAYFSKLKFTPVTRVVETANVPKTHIAEYELVPDASGAREPIGERIIETTKNFAHYQIGDDHDGFVAYVPPGSIARGAVIAAKGEGRAPPCESCHGAKLEGQTMPGIGIVPPLAGRSPTYIVREMILFQIGKRANPGAAPMRLEASHLTVPEMIDVAAYAASRKP
ncbi:MAG: c-type cytochrome [Gammaproteobacteria bacterium]